MRKERMNEGETVDTQQGEKKMNIKKENKTAEIKITDK